MGAARGSRHPYVPRRERTWAATDGAQCAQAWRDSCMDSCIMGAHGHGGAVQRARGARERWRERACAKELTPAPHGRIWKHFARFTGHSRFRILHIVSHIRMSSIVYRPSRSNRLRRLQRRLPWYSISYSISIELGCCELCIPSAQLFSPALFLSLITSLCDWRTALPLRIGTVCS